MVKMKCLRAEHIKGRREVVCNLPRDAKREYDPVTRITTVPKSDGFGIKCHPDEIFLVIKDDDCIERKIPIGGHFGQYWKKFTPTIIQRIKDIPDDIEVIVEIKEDDEKLFNIPEIILDKLFLEIYEKRKKEKV